MNARVKPSIKMASLADLAEKIATLETCSLDEADLCALVILRTQRDRLRRQLGLGPMRAAV